jgi:hypothetical protein
MLAHNRRSGPLSGGRRTREGGGLGSQKMSKGRLEANIGFQWLTCCFLLSLTKNGDNCMEYLMLPNKTY